MNWSLAVLNYDLNYISNVSTDKHQSLGLIRTSQKQNSSGIVIVIVCS